MRVFFTILIFLALPALSVSQHIEIFVNNFTISRGSLSSVSGEKTSLIDSIISNKSGEFAFTINEHNNHLGLYRVSLDKNRWIDFVNDGEDTKLITDADNIADSLRVVTSESNRLFYSFVSLNKQYKTKSELLQLILSRYPYDDPYYTTTQTTLSKLQKEYSVFINITSQTRPSSFVARYIRSAQLPVVDFHNPIDEQLKYLKSHALDNVNFNDDELVYSDLFTNKSIEYLTYYRNPQLPRELLEKEFSIAIHTLLGKAKVNQLVYQHIAEYLINGFRKFGFETCIGYILDNYVIKDDLCLGEEFGSTIQRMIEQKKKLPIGATAPNVALPDKSGNVVSLDTMRAEKILVLFYSSSCPHCQAMIPRLAKIYEDITHNRPEVIAVSMDSSRADWIKFVTTHNLRWINVNDPQGWAGRAATDYFIYATPTMFLIDKDKKIIAKPLTVEEVMKY